MPLFLCLLLSLAACSGAQGHQRAKFDGDAALQYAAAQVKFGPRVPGTVAAKQAGDWIVSEMEKRADTVIVQAFNYKTANGTILPLRNILARYKPNEAQRVLYVTHWDTRPVADEDLEMYARQKSFDGANDGASGVGLFVALGDVLKQTPPSYGVDLLFVDGEDWGTFGPPDVDVLIGSTYFSQHLPSADYKPVFGVLWDMIGDSDLQIYQEVNSLDAAPEVVKRVWDAADKLGYSKYFIPDIGYTVTDDHIPLIGAGLRVIDVIDLDFPYHHTHLDTMDKISAKSLQTVGDVATALVTGG
jgi:Zn-dependent M28 family amino/carboxypeptidase